MVVEAGIAGASACVYLRMTVTWGQYLDAGRCL